MNREDIVTSVIDTGIGIKNEDIDELFKPFHQIETGIMRKYEGTGLGLSICKKILDLLGGSILVKSEWGKGSIFSFTLPVERRL
jgi:signal transduction histidine kinase